MKKNKTAFLLIIFILCLGLQILISCNNSTGNKVEDSIDTITTKVESKVADIKKDYEEYRDENFVRDVIERNTAELHLLSLALQKGTNKELKDDAKKMQTDHRKLDADMHAYATKKSYSIPSMQDEMKDDLDNNLAGPDWDKNWINKIINEHEKVVEKFENAESKANDPELKEIITNTLPILRNHLNMAKTLQEKMQK